jgi:(p)ppGpp synthase/HD superfamily hydrolase
MSLIIEAAQFAAKSHTGQQRKYSGRPYIEHPMRVAGRATLLKGDDGPFFGEAGIAAAWLHDVVEDCDVTQQTVGDLFGGDVAELVGLLTDRSKEDHPNLNRAGRKRIECERLRACAPTVRAIKLLDRIDNLSEMISDSERHQDALDFLRVYRKESALLLEALTGAHGELEAELRGLIG